MEPTLIEKQNKRYGTDWETAIRHAINDAKAAKSGTWADAHVAALSQRSLAWTEIAKFLVPND